MKTTRYFSLLLSVLFVLSSCENTLDNEMLIGSKTELLAQTEKAVNSDSLDVISPLPETEEMKLLKERLKEMNRKMLRSARTYIDDYDVNLSSNMWAIRELPISIKVRNQNLYFTSNGHGKEIFLSSYYGRDNSRIFYLKMFAPSTGIPYMIYSQQTRTPIAVGQYGSNPDDKIVFALNSDVTGGTSLYNATWDLISSSNYMGHFAIQSQSYLGQSDPNNPWSVFHHVIEARANNKLRYGEYTKKAEQEFLITPVAEFNLKGVKYINQYSAKITSITKEKVERAFTNRWFREQECDLKFDDTVSEYSYFNEKTNSINFNRKIENGFKAKAPEIAGNKIFLEPSQNSVAKLPYVPNSNIEIETTLDGQLLLTVPPRLRIDVTYWYSVYNVEVEYEAISIYEGREIKHSGTWIGKIYVDDIGQEQHSLKKTKLDTNEVESVQLKIVDKTTRIKI